MIKIKNNIECCGCSACTEICPKQCISFDEDQMGFRYPKVKLDLCINCNLCEKVCPVINKPIKQNISKTLAAINTNDKIRYDSSSGGIFSAIAENIIKNGGVVFGAMFDERWEVKHGYIEKIEDLTKLRGSKYLQSRIESSYREALTFLKAGREVLFSGTPCQIAGLHGFLRHDYENLIAIDFICHGVPSPKVWRKYLNQLIKQKKIGQNLSDIHNINFRSKDHGWSKYDLLIESKEGRVCSEHTNDPYLRAFNMNITLRPICFSCPFKGGHTNSNLTIADFWGISTIDPSIHDDKGTSMIIDYGNFKIGYGNNIITKPVENNLIKEYNPSYYHSSQYNGNRIVLFNKLDSSKDIRALLLRCTNPTRLQRLMNVLYRKIKPNKI